MNVRLTAGGLGSHPGTFFIKEGEAASYAAFGMTSGRRRGHALVTIISSLRDS